METNGTVKGQKIMTPAERAKHFTPGNVIKSTYWGSYDLVLKYAVHTDGDWFVYVQQVSPVETTDSVYLADWPSVGAPRWHRTEPDPKDKVVVTGLLPIVYQTIGVL
jgi:hypothetical protein